LVVQRSCDGLSERHPPGDPAVAEEGEEVIRLTSTLSDESGAIRAWLDECEKRLAKNVMDHLTSTLLYGVCMEDGCPVCKALARLEEVKK
jgi:hypothetical protein